VAIHSVRRELQAGSAAVEARVRLALEVESRADLADMAEVLVAIHPVRELQAGSAADLAALMTVTVAAVRRWVVRFSMLAEL